MLASGVACLPQHVHQVVEVAHALGLGCSRRLCLTGLFCLISLRLAGGRSLVRHGFEHTGGCPLGVRCRFVLKRVVGVRFVIRLLRLEVSLNGGLVFLINYLVAVVVVLLVVCTLGLQRLNDCIQIGLRSFLGILTQSLGHVRLRHLKCFITGNTCLLILSGLVQHLLFGGADVTL